MRKQLISWQWSLYRDGHGDRRNLLIHVLSVPLFMLGTLLVVAAGFLWPAFVLVGLVGMVAALALQGRGHRFENVRPVPFESPVDFVSRFFAEQWVTFPRYVFSGEFAKAWKNAGTKSPKS